MLIREGFELVEDVASVGGGDVETDGLDWELVVALAGFSYCGGVEVGEKFLCVV